MRVSSFDYDHFGMMPAFHVLDLGDSLRRHSLGMLQNLVANFVSSKHSISRLGISIPASDWKSNTFPCDLYSLENQVDTAAKLPRRERIRYGYMRGLRE